MNEIIALLKQVGIFMVCAQTVVHFKPQQKYDKYLKLLIGVMVMAQLVSPVLTFLGGEKGVDVEAALPEVWSGPSFDIDGMLGTADEIVDKYTENEIKSRLNNDEMKSKEEIVSENAERVNGAEVDKEETQKDRIVVEDIEIEEIRVGEEQE